MDRNSLYQIPSQRFDKTRDHDYFNISKQHTTCSAFSKEVKNLVSF